MEALALGIPLVISDTPAIRELVGEGNATLFESEMSLNYIKNYVLQLMIKKQLKRWLKGIRWVRNRGHRNFRKENSREYNKHSILN